jgi:hypothetical protein
MKRVLTIVLAVIILHGIFPLAYAGQKVFATWEGFEADKLASIWLIKRFIAPDARILIFPKGSQIGEGIQFDTPYSPASRRFNRSTFESLLEHYQIKNSKLEGIGRLIHDIEINIWGEKVFVKSSELIIRVNDLLEKHKDNEQIISGSMRLFDDLYSNLPRELEKSR